MDIVSGSHKRGRLFFPAAIAFAGCLVYSNSFHVPFIFDDIPNIVENSSIKSIWPPWSPFIIPFDVGISGRPAVNFTLALNYMISGMSVWSYHLFNLLFHLAAAMTLFGLVHRTLQFKSVNERYRSYAVPLAGATGLIWVVHALQTGAVVYVVQRCEVLMGLFYFLTVYCAVRGWQSTKTRAWHLAALLAYIWGFGAKEVIITAPLVILLYDYTFVSQNIINALRKSPWLYGGLLFGMIVQTTLVLIGATSSKVAGDVYTPLEYLLTQPSVIIHYLRLSILPWPLCLDYAWARPETINVIISATSMLLLAAAGIYLSIKRRAAGFLLAWFFLILTPTSSIMPLPDPIFEHRMYLSLAAVAVFVVFGIFILVRNRFADNKKIGKRGLYVLWGVYLTLIFTLGATAHFRLEDYKTSVRIWADTVNKQPVNVRARINLATNLQLAGRSREAGREFMIALQFEPDNHVANYGMGVVFSDLNQPARSIPYYQKALEEKSTYVKARYNLALALLTLNRAEEAISHLTKAINQYPEEAKLYFTLGVAYGAVGDVEKAIESYRHSLDLDPGMLKAYNNLGLLYSRQGQFKQAAAEFREAIKIDPHFPLARFNYGDLLIKNNNPEEAVTQFLAGIEAAPKDVRARIHVGAVLQELGRCREARHHLEKALEINPDNKKARELLRKCLTDG